MAELLVRPAWSLPPGVHAFVSTRHGGNSSGDYHSLNLGQHVGDVAAVVESNRAALLQALQQQSGAAALELQWMQQVHGTSVTAIDKVLDAPPVADALYTTQSHIALNVLTADCLPVLFCSNSGEEIAVAHAGWRGLCNGVLESVLLQFRCAPTDVRCWLGPAIGPCHFEVGSDVRDAFLMLSRQTWMAATKAAFTPGPMPGKWMADLYALARIRLQKSGVTDIAGTSQCTVCLADDYYSYRQQQVTGRFATGIVKVS